MTRLSKILKDHHESGAMNALVNIHTAVDEHTFLTKGGDLEKAKPLAAHESPRTTKLY